MITEKNIQQDIENAIKLGKAMKIAETMDEMEEAHKEMELEDRYDVEEDNLKNDEI